MADGTRIEWTDATWQIVTGCSVVSPGCTNCYAMKLAGTRLQHHPSRAGLTIGTKAGPVWNGQVRFNAEWLDQPIRWRKPRRIFVAAHGDLFHEGVTDAQLDQVFAVMALCPQHTFQVLTKRPERMRAYLADPARRSGAMAELGESVLPLPLYDGFGQKQRALALQQSTRVRWQDARDRLAGCYLPNVWLGVSVEDQARADERIPILLDTPSAVRWISAEPLLGPVDLEPWLSWKGDYLPGPDSTWWGCGGCDTDCPTCPRGKAVFAYPEGPKDADGVPEWITEHRITIDWVVAGGESGPSARPLHPAWVSRLRDQCTAAGTPFLFKQWGAWAPTGNTVELAGGSGRPYVAWPDGQIAHGQAYDHGGPGVILREAGKKAAGRLLDGVLHDAFPEPRAA